MMKTIKIAALFLIVAGTLGLVYGNFNFTKETHDSTLGMLEVIVNDLETLNVPVWAAIGAIGVGGFILLFGCKSRCTIQ